MAKTAIGIGIGSLAVVLGIYLLMQSSVFNTTQIITETGLKNESINYNSTDSANPIKVTYSNFSIPYSIFNAKMLGMTADTQSKLLLVSIKTGGAGNLTMEIPRALIDAKFGTHDDRFSVRVDGKEIDYKESKTNISRILTVPFQDGIQQIQIREPSLPNMTHVTDTNFFVSYDITNGTVKGLKGDVYAVSMIISIETTNNGVITITIPRGLVDSQMGNQDDSFFVLIDGEEVNFQEIHSTSADRTLSIHFEHGAREIEIIGTSY